MSWSILLITTALVLALLGATIVLQQISKEITRLRQSLSHTRAAQDDE